uniref:CHORD domain-containing protein n=1 Tax=Ananas comosus var. bracteatus TaxID=296719 RepID=A0A6V7Q1G2_ANACO|nr:unnamed protein product [Ananas comosus var. bracteatus]
MAKSSGGAVRCQRIGCDAMFTDDDNVEGSCRYHDSPIFHDGMKEWSCCKQRSHDFSLFLAIPGCKTGKHTTEKPVTKAVSANPRKRFQFHLPLKTLKVMTLVQDVAKAFSALIMGKPSKPATANAPKEETVVKDPAPTKKIVNLNEPRTCKNKGCGKTYKEKDNHETACEYHPGPAVFHDRMRGWKCCDIHVKEFDEFMEIPPCTKGWHNADAA